MKLSGGQAIVDRLLKAYGFSTKKELGDYFGLGNGTVSTWIKRNHFPGEQVVRCALEKKASLQWLATGEGEMQSFLEDVPCRSQETIFIEKKKIVSGKLVPCGTSCIDRSLLQADEDMLLFVQKNQNNWVVDISESNISNGLWLLDIDSDVDVYNVSRIPGNRIRVMQDSFSFECNVCDVNVLGSVLLTVIRNK